MDLLIDMNVAVDICAKRPAYYQDADLALAKCRQEGGRLWLYAGSVQTLEYVTRAELKRSFRAAGQPIKARQLQHHTRQIIKTFAEDKQWLAALAAEGAVFDSPDPEDAQLIRALDRFAPGTIKHARQPLRPAGGHGRDQRPKTLPWPQDDRTSVFAQYTLRVQDRDALQARLHQAGIPTAVHYPVPLNEQPAYAHRCCPDCTPVAKQIAREVMSLPMHPDLTAADQHRIVASLLAPPLQST